MSESSSKPKGHRLWIPLLIIVLAAGGTALVRAQADLETNLRSWVIAMIVGLALVLGLLWFLLLSRVHWLRRLGVLILLVFGGLFIRNNTRVDGTVDGTGLPNVVWKWSPKKEVQLAAPSPAPPARLELLAIQSAGFKDVPQFFGPNRDGVVSGANLSDDWKTIPPRQLWRQPIGAGWSAFAVAGARAYTQEQRGEDELVTCYEALTGRLLWAHTNHVRFDQWQGGPGPRATPTIVGGRLYAIGATGVLDCLDPVTGQLFWTRSVLDENKLPNIIWGVSCSPLVADGLVVVAGGATNGPSLLAYQAATGEPAWKAGTDKASYASPVAATIAGQRVALSVNAASLTIHDLRTGRVLLSYIWSDDKWPKAAQPAVLSGDRVFLSAGYGTGCVMLQVKQAVDGTLVATELWKGKSMKTQFNSVSVRDGYIYGLDDGLMACVDATTGTRKWKDGRYGSGQSLLADDLLVVQSEQGSVVLVRAKADAFEELGRIAALNAKTWNHPALSGHYLLTRNDQEAVCYELPVKANPAAAIKP